MKVGMVIVMVMVLVLTNSAGRTVVYANSHAIAHDERVYKDPYKFNPDRYEAGEPNPVGNFGFGRRYVQQQFNSTPIEA